jgi:hypothetical protein
MIIPCILKPEINNNQIKWGLSRFQGVELFNEYNLGIDLYRILTEKILRSGK